jgi:hypothetical protein
MMQTTRVTVDTVTIPDRFNGPAGSANGGYACGLLAGLIDGPAQVILRRPPPLGVELAVEHTGDAVALRHSETLIATGTPTPMDLESPRPPTFGQALDLSAGYAGFTHHPFPTCFVCGPSRTEDDGLRIFPGSLPGRQIMAAAWIPDQELADGRGLVRPEFVWAALDCPTGWVTSLLPPIEKVVVLGTLAVAIQHRPQAGGRHVLVSWPIGNEGKKFRAGAALWSDAGLLLAVARATWIQVSVEGWAE